MLVLTRCIGETLMIGDNISITILAVKGTQVRLGIKAPPTVSVHRAEVYNKFTQKKRLGSFKSPVYRSEILITKVG